MYIHTYIHTYTRIMRGQEGGQRGQLSRRGGTDADSQKEIMGLLHSLLHEYGAQDHEYHYNVLGVSKESKWAQGGLGDPTDHNP